MNRIAKLWRKGLAAALAVTLMAGLAACGSGDTAEDGGAQKETAVLAEESAAGETESAVSWGRYMEREISLPEGAVNQARSMAVKEDGLYYFDSVAGLWELAGESWEQVQSMEALQGGLQMSTPLYGAVRADGAVVVADFGMADSGEYASSVYLADANGSFREVESVLPAGDWINGLAFGEDGNAYAYSLMNRICRIDMESGEMEVLFSAADSVEMLAFTGNLLLALETGGVEIYDLSQGVLQDPDSVLSDFCVENMKYLNTSSDSEGGLLFGAPEGILYVVCREGVYRHVLGGTAMEQIIDGKFTSLADPTLGLNALAALEDGSFLLLNIGDSLLRYVYDPEEPTVPSEQLKVYSLTENDRLRQMISRFQKENPEVWVNYEIGMPEGSAITRSDAQKNLNTELMSGNGPDVLLFDGIDPQPYVKKGMLADLSDVLAGMTGEEALFSHIASSFASEEGTFLIPAQFRLPLIFGEREDLERVEGLESLANLVERLREETAEGTVAGNYSARQVLNQLFSVCSGSWLVDGALDEGQLEEFLAQAKRIYDADMVGVDAEQQEAMGQSEGPSDLGSRSVMQMIGQAQIAYGSVYGIFDLGPAGKMMEEDETLGFALFSGQDGSGFEPINLLAVSKTAKRPELAQVFVQAMLSFEGQEPNLYDGLPVNIRAFEEQCVFEEGLYMSGSWRLGGQELRFGYGAPGKPVMDRLRELVEAADHPLVGNAVINEAVLKYGEQVLQGELSVQEGVSAIKKAVAIYLAEQG